MKTFKEECGALAPLESFDPTAFRAGPGVPQELCNFVLALALIHNDCKGAIYARVLLAEATPDPPIKKNRHCGAWYGVDFQLFRLFVGLLHELFDLIRDNQASLQEPFLREVLKQLASDSRRAWDAVVTVASGGTPSDSLGRRLLLLRNKASFHYDPKAIFSGYSHHFLSATPLDDRAFISRGKNMQENRFYFADAAATGYLSAIMGRSESDEMRMDVAELLRTVNHALLYIVDAFIQRRGYPYRVETE